MSKIKTTTSDWINFLIHKRRGLDEITNNIWRTYYAERTISLTAVSILTTSILVLASIYNQIDTHSIQGSINLIPLISVFLSGIDVYIIGRYFLIKKQAMEAILKLIPFRKPLDEMLLKVMHRKYKDINELEKEYEEKLKPYQDLITEMSKPILTRMDHFL